VIQALLKKVVQLRQQAGKEKNLQILMAFQSFFWLFYFVSPESQRLDWSCVLLLALSKQSLQMTCDSFYDRQ
jgi:hypothetical protein